MSKKRIGFFNSHKNIIFITTVALVTAGCFAFYTFYPPLREERRVEQCMNSTYKNGYHPARETCEKYKLTPDGYIVTED